MTINEIIGDVISFGILPLILAFAFPALAEAQPSEAAENAYTNHAGNAVSGWPVKLTSKQVVLVECDTAHYPLATNHYPLATTNSYPLSIFPEMEQRRIAADYALSHPEAGIAALRVPVSVKRAIAGADKAMAPCIFRSRKNWT